MMESAFFEKLSTEKKKHIEVLLLPQYKGVWITAIEKYPGEAHFINELLQNADDANASKVVFELSEDGLIFKHNGSIRFTVSDTETAEYDRQNGKYGHINSITGLGDSQKIREQKIGKFGIGFKAVFAYTANPEIYDDYFSFRIDNFIVPVSIKDDRNDRAKGETLFYFPFNHASKTKKIAYAEVEKKLKSLQNSIIFLHHIREISWKAEKEFGNFKKMLHTSEKLLQYSDLLSEFYHVSSVIGNKRIPETFRTFTKNIVSKDSNINQKISIAFKLKGNSGFDSEWVYGAFCFFPTQEITNQKFLIHAPFLLTDNRQNLLPNQEWNKFLINELVGLTKDAFLIIRDEDFQQKKSILSTDLLNFIPYDQNLFFDQNTNNPIQFYPFYLGFIELLQQEQILPGRYGAFFQSKHAYWATDRELVDLFSDEQLSQMLGTENAGFVFTDLGQKNAQYTNRPLANYLKDLVNDILDPEKLIRLISKEFIEGQSIEWILKFYEYLNNKPSYLAISRDFPVVVADDNSAIIPFDKKRLHYKVFLPTPSSTEFKTVHPQLYQSEIGKLFFKNLGLSTPDIQAVFLSTVLKNYDKDEISINDDDLLNHTKTLLEFYKSQDTTEFEKYIDRISKLHFFCGRTGKSESQVFLYRSSDLYKPTDDLLEFFEDFEEVVFFDENFYKPHFSSEELAKLYNILDLLKIKSYPDIETLEANPTHALLDHFHLSSHKLNRVNNLYDKEIHAIDNFFQNITLYKSVAGWKLLKELIRKNSDESYNAFGLIGVLEFKLNGKRKFSYTTFESSALKSLRSTMWLVDKENNLVAPHSITIDNLHDNYDVSSPLTQILISLLHFKSEIQDPELSEQQKEIYDIGKLINQAGYSEDQVLEALAILHKKNTPEDEKSVEAPQSGVIDDFSNDKPEVVTKKKSVIQIVSDLTAELFEDITDNETTRSEIVTPRSVQSEHDLPDTAGEYFPPIDLEEEYAKRMEEVKREIEELAIVQQLKNDVIENDKYSYGWFKALMELESLKSAELNANSKEISIAFAGAKLEEEDSRILVLSKPNRLIPQSIEEIGDLVLKVFEDGKPQSVSIEVVNVKEYTIRAKVRRKSDIAKINFNKVSKVVIDIKNPIFLLEELNKNLIGFDFEDDYNLKDNITENIKFIFGPPGTGKTTYLATDEIIPLMKSNKDLKVLVLTPTNKSADVLSSRIIEKMESDNSYLDWLIRFGPAGDKKITEELGEDYKGIDINNYGNAVVVSTVARYAYDFFQVPGSFHKENLRHFPWDFIVIDEASMITLPNVINVLYSQRQADFIIAGDPFQITPISQVQQWKDENIYTMINLLSFTDPKTEPHKFDIINRYTQYRSIPAIGKVFSMFTYDDKLLHHRTQSDKRIANIPGLDLKDLNIIKFPVRKNESIFSPNSLNGSKYQIYSALFTVELVLKIAQLIKENNTEFFRIGVICPYRAQADIIEKIISQQFTNNESVEILVGTIHGFQGDECEFIFTIFNPPFKIDGSPDMFLNKQNILNVAISRAKDYLFILMPDEHSPNVSNLKKINQIADLCFVSGNNHYKQFTSLEIEKKLFGSSTYIFDNSFATSHQQVNVYSDPVKKYEVRCEEKAVDVQIMQ